MTIPANNRAIVGSAWKAARGALEVEATPGYCLRTVRQIIQDAFNINHEEFYRQYRVTVTTATPERTLGDVPYAADVERTIKLKGLHLPPAYLTRGDIVFDHTAAAPMGHIGVMIDDNTVLENVDIAYRNDSTKLRNGLVLTPRFDFKMTLIARL